MKYTPHVGEKQIWFEIAAQSEDVIDLFAFLHLIMMKFEGEVVRSHRYSLGKKKMYFVNIQFAGWGNASDAKAHCDRNIKSGSIVAGYRGALDKADPGRVAAYQLKEEADKQR